MRFQPFGRRLRVAALLPMLALGIAACDDDDDPIDPGPGSLVDVANAEPRLATLVSALEAANLDPALEGTGPFTVFAPVNSAFDALPAVTLGALLEDQNEDLLTSILTYHVVPGTVFAEDLADGQVITTLQGSQLTVGIDGGNVTLTDVSGQTVSVVEADLEASNGVIHLIDTIVLPNVDLFDRTVLDPQLTTLTAGIRAAGLEETVRTSELLTIFGPTNTAFEALPAGKLETLLLEENQDILASVITYHVVEGEVRSEDLSDGQVVMTVQGDELTVNIDGETVTLTDVGGNEVGVVATDIGATNGVIHKVDGVLMPGMDIIETARINGFTTLVELVETAGLTETLQSDNAGDNWTVFAPTNEAFDALASVPEGGALEQVLLYHVVSGEVYRADLSDGQVVTTAALEDFTVTVGGETGAVFITDGTGAIVNVTATDVMATNGVIHVLDGVLLPPPAP
jgi:uncharacterized surface protein with fasciclin (FAS1) repeats